jgi:hypothetical protein
MRQVGDPALVNIPQASTINHIEFAVGQAACRTAAWQSSSLADALLQQ